MGAWVGDGRAHLLGSCAACRSGCQAGVTGHLRLGSTSLRCTVPVLRLILAPAGSACRASRWLLIPVASTGRAGMVTRAMHGMGFTHR